METIMKEKKFTKDSILIRKGYTLITTQVKIPLDTIVIAKDVYRCPLLCPGTLCPRQVVNLYRIPGNFCGYNFRFPNEDENLVYKEEELEFDYE